MIMIMYPDSFPESDNNTTSVTTYQHGYQNN